MSPEVIADVRDCILGVLAQKVGVFNNLSVEALPAVYEGCLGIAETETVLAIQECGMDVSLDEWIAGSEAARQSAQELCEFDVLARWSGASPVALRNHSEAHA